MPINVSPDIEKSILAAVQSGRFHSVDEAVTTAWLELIKQRADLPPVRVDEAEENPDPLFGLWRDYADEMDEIVADAYRQRREETWREVDL